MWRCYDLWVLYKIHAMNHDHIWVSSEVMKVLIAVRIDTDYHSAVMCYENIIKLGRVAIYCDVDIGDSRSSEAASMIHLKQKGRRFYLRAIKALQGKYRSRA